MTSSTPFTIRRAELRRGRASLQIHVEPGQPEPRPGSLVRLTSRGHAENPTPRLWLIESAVRIPGSGLWHAELKLPPPTL